MLRFFGITRCCMPVTSWPLLDAINRLQVRMHVQSAVCRARCTGASTTYVTLSCWSPPVPVLWCSFGKRHIYSKNIYSSCSCKKLIVTRAPWMRSQTSSPRHAHCVFNDSTPHAVDTGWPCKKSLVRAGTVHILLAPSQFNAVCDLVGAVVDRLIRRK